jgi:xanthine dehydrogenase accessory factor
VENLDLMVLRALRDWRASGRHALLATVVRTWGSSPRPVGSIMALSYDGAVVGSVSGGCIEDDLIFCYAQAYVGNEPCRTSPFSPPSLVKYGVTADEAHRFGLPCGGTLELLLEYDPDAALLTQLMQALESGQLVRRIVRVADGKASIEVTATPEELSFGRGVLANTFGPEYRMLLIGGGQLTEYLATMALFSGFAVTVCEPREEYRRGWSVAGAKVVSGMPDDVVTAFRPDRRSCVVALTHDPKLDDLALMEALGTEAFYVGAIGSRRNNQARHARMAEHFSLPATDLRRLRGPIGVYIGSKTPPEIAVSIMAEILAVKNGVHMPPAMEVARAKDERELVQNHSSP